MFIKMGIKKAISDIEKYFPYLFENGYQIVTKKYDEKHFGNWIVILHSDKSGVRIVNDRRQIVVMIGPPWAPTELYKENHYFDMKLLIAYLEKNEVVDFHADLQHMELQYKIISEQFLSYYPAIIKLINDPDFENIETELKHLNQNILAKSFPKFFSKKP